MKPPRHPPRDAMKLVLSRGVSAFGGAMVTFGIDAWIFRSTGSYPTFALLMVLTFLPNLVLAPFTGMLVDRSSKKTLLVACELASLATTALAWIAFGRSALGTGVAAVVILSQSIVSHVRWTAMSVTISVLTPPESLGGVNGVQQAIQGVLDVCSPILGALALQGAGLDGILAVGLLTGLVGLAGLARVPGGPLRAPEAPSGPAGGLWRDATFGLRWIRRQPMLARLLLFVMAYNLAGSVFTVTFTPYLLSHGPVTLLGLASALEGGAALLVGFALLSAGARSRPLAQVLGGALAFGLVMAAWGFARGAAALCALAFLAGLLTSLVVASLQMLWQASVPVAIQGQVFAARRMVSFLLVPLAVLASIPLAQHVFAPCLASSPLAAGLWGPGQGGALGMMLSVLGALLAAGSLWSARRIESPASAPVAASAG